MGSRKRHSRHPGYVGENKAVTRGPGETALEGFIVGDLKTIISWDLWCRGRPKGYRATQVSSREEHPWPRRKHLRLRMHSQPPAGAGDIVLPCSCFLLKFKFSWSWLVGLMVPGEHCFPSHHPSHPSPTSLFSYPIPLSLRENLKLEY